MERLLLADGSNPAWNALPTGFIAKEGGNPQSQIVEVGRSAERHDDRRPERNAGGARVLEREGKIEKRIPLLGDKEDFDIGNVEWAPDGKTLYATLARSTGPSGGRQLGVLEIPTDGDNPIERL